MAGEVKRDEHGRVVSGALNPGGRAVARERRFAKAIGADTDDGLTLRRELQFIAGDRKHKDQLAAIKELLLRYLGPYSKTPLEDDELAPELTEAELFEASKAYVAAVEARHKEKPNDQPSVPEQAEAGAVPGVGGAAAGAGQRGDGD